MSRNYKKALMVLQKWTLIPPGREFMDFGLYLRELAQASFPTKELFSGNEFENTLKLNSLLRIAENKYGKEYSPLRIGALGMEKESFSQLFEKENFKTMAKVTQQIK